MKEKGFPVMKRAFWKSCKKNTATLLLAAAVCLTGCGSQGEMTKAGMEQITALDYSAALASFEGAIEKGEDQELAYRGEGMAYLGLSDYENAIAAFEKALSMAGMFPSDTEADINYYLATAQYKAGQKQEAADTLSAIAGIRDKQPEVYFLRGSIEMEMGNDQAAVEDLNLALYYDDHSTDMTIRVYRVFDENGKKDEGRGYLTNAIEERLSTMSDYEKGMIYYYLEDYENARDNLEAYRATGNNDTDTLLMLGRTYEQLGDSNYAASLYQKYLDENEPNAVIWNQLGLCKLEAGQYAEALSAFNSGLETENNQSVLQELQYNRIVASEYSGDFQQAAGWMREYLNSYPDDTAAQREMSFLQTR